MTSPGVTTSATALGATSLRPTWPTSSLRRRSRPPRACRPASRPAASRGRKPTTALVRFDLQHHAEPPGLDVGRTLDARRAPCPSRRRCRSWCTGPRQPLRAIELHEAVHQRAARHACCRRGIERRAHREAAVVELVLAELRQQRAPHFLGEVIGGEDVRAGLAEVDAQRLGLGRLGLFAVM